MMRKTILVLVVGLAIWSCTESGASDANADKQVASVSKKPEAEAKKVDGEKIYKKRCVVCHGINGDMGMSGAKDLTQSELSIEEKMTIITNGKNVMTAFGEILEEDEIKAVAEYTLTLKK